MDRISSTGTIDIGGGRAGFQDENLGAGIQGTDVVAAWLNAIQEEVVGVIAAAGLVPSSADWTQLLQGLRLLCGGHFAVFTANGSFTVPAGITSVQLVPIGGGGGGGSAGATGAGQSDNASGGGSGGIGFGVFAVTPGQVLAITIGAAGSAGTAGSAGGNGGDTVVTGLMTAHGGYGGLASTASAVPQIVPGGGGALVGTGGLINLRGSPGAPGYLFSATNGLGGYGAGILGTLGGASTSGAGGAGSTPGAGGGGAANGPSAAAANGGAGAAGLVIVGY